MDMRLTYNNSHSIWTVIDPTSEFVHIEFGWSFFCNLHRHIFNFEEYKPTLVNIELGWMMILKFSHRIKMFFGQHLLVGSTYTCVYTYIFWTNIGSQQQHRIWMGIDIHLPIENLDDFWFTLASTNKY